MYFWRTIGKELTEGESIQIKPALGRSVVLVCLHGALLLAYLVECSCAFCIMHSCACLREIGWAVLCMHWLPVLSDIILRIYHWAPLVLYMQRNPSSRAVNWDLQASIFCTFWNGTLSSYSKETLFRLAHNYTYVTLMWAGLWCYVAHNTGTGQKLVTNS